MEEVSEACTSNLEGSVTRSLQTDGGQALLDASISKELLAVRPRPWCDLALGRGPWAAGSRAGTRGQPREGAWPVAPVPPSPGGERGCVEPGILF